MFVRHLSVQILSSCLTILMGLFSFVSSAHADEKTICTMTFNSPDEKNMLKEIYEKQGVKFVELVPEERNDQWLNNACRSGIQCDILLISGHFGGVFFGETSGLSMSLPEMETAACRSDCAGIFKKPQEVFLYGCNTLAGKKKDARTFEEYVQILVRDGFDRELAESVALTRYADLGLSMAERFSSVFTQTPRIHGYSSTGPLGKNIAPALKNIFTPISAEHLFSTGSPIQKMRQTLAGSSYAVSKGASVGVPGNQSLQTSLICHPENMNDEAFALVFSDELFKKHYDTILNLSSSALFMKNLKAWADRSGANENRIRQSFDLLAARSEMTLGTRLKMIELYQGLDWLSREGAQYSKKSFLKKKIQEMAVGGFSYQEAEQLCGLKPHLKGLELDRRWLPVEVLASDYLPTIESCLAEPTAVTPSEPPIFLMRCFAEASQRATPELRDKARWSCYNSFESQVHTVNDCQNAAAHFETDSRIGLDWSCIKTFANELTVDNCLIAASRNQDPSNGDDMLWGCWSRLKNRPDFTASQCLKLSVNMQIHGNRLKMNWNCQNRL